MLPAQDHGAPRLLCLLCAIIFLFCSSSMYVEAQTLASAGVASSASASNPPVSAGASAPAAGRGADAEPAQIQLLVGRSTVLNVGAPIVRVSLTRPEIADAVPTSTQQLLIHGKAAGSITMFVWDRLGGIKRYEVTVGRDLDQVIAQLQQLFPGEPIKVTSNGKNLVLSGTVSSKYVAERAADVAAGFAEKKDDVVNLLQLREGSRSNQVLLRVRFAEVSRQALTELGASFFTSPMGYKDYTARATTEQFPAPYFDTKDGNPALIFSDFLNLFLFNNKEGLGTLIRALTNRGLFQSLAEPNLVAENGKEASFLAGGEYPYPAVQGNAATLAVTIVFKEFGIRLNFTPTILGDDQVRLKVRPEVSSLDFSNAVSYQGFRIPSLQTRRAETEVELANGQTFAIAGLLNNTMTSTLQKIPGIGDIPILGLLFKSKAAQKSQTELVVMITPVILPRGSNGVTDRLPGQVEPYLPPIAKPIPPPPPYPGTVPRDAPEPIPPAAAAQTATPPAAGPAAMPAATTASAAAPAAPPQATPPAPALAGVQPAPSSSPAQAVSQPAPAAQPDPKASEREAKEVKKRLEAEAKEQQKQQAEQQKLKEAEAKRAAEEAKRQQKIDAEVAKRAEDAARVQKAKAEEARKQQEKIAREQAKRDAEAAKKQAEIDRKKALEVREVEDRLKAAQAAYEAAVQKAKQK